MYVRTKQIPPDEGNWYRYLVRAERKNDQVQQKVVKYLGKATGPDDHSIHEDDDLDDLPDDIEDKLGTTEEGFEKYVGDGRFNGVVRRQRIDEDEDIDELAEELQERVDKHEHWEGKVEVNHDKNEIIIYRKTYHINPTTEYGKEADHDYAYDIKESGDDYIHYTSERDDGEEYIMSKKKSEVPQKYKVYNYSDGDYVFVDDKKTPIEEMK